MGLLERFVDSEYIGDAAISSDGLYRYYLSRFWEGEKPKLGWVLLNPSTADSEINDPTIRRCLGFAKSLGFGSIVVVNLFSIRTSKPMEMKKSEAPIGPMHWNYMEKLEGCQQIIAGWGAGWKDNPQTQNCIDFVCKKLRRPLYALAKTADGSPGHPLYLKKSLKPFLWKDYAK